jgi:outer membrane protein OmpA-like peptidoglycan-associated protein
MKLRTTLLGVTCLGLPIALGIPGTASAQPINGVYVSLGAGANWLSNEKTNSSPGLATPSVKLKSKTGGMSDIAVGYGLGNGLRFELEGDYRFNGVGGISGTAGPTTSSGNQQQYGAMVNAVYDMDVGIPYFFPYIGVGVGYGWDQFRDVGVTSVGGTPFSFNANHTFGNFAYQAILGASFPIPQVPGLAATLEYRFYGILGPQGYGASSTGFVAPGVTSNGNLDIKGTPFNNAVVIGLRYAFNVAPPAPPPAPVPVAAPAPAPSRTYLVFFDWDRADLTDRARQIISEAARNSTRVQYTRLQVNGYTDTSGAPAYNQRLSVRRAEAVAAELVRDGVPRNAIAIQGFGETHLLVPTGANVREPQNRRVEIIIQ